MSILDLASLVLAPTAVKDGKVYNAIPNDQDFTFSRGTEATRVNSAGLIEKARTNFLLQSNTFDTTWSTTSASVTGGQSGYDGTNDAWLFSRSSSIGYLFQLKSLSASINTISIYVKQGTSSTIRLDFVTGAFAKGASCTFDLSNGTAGSVTHYGSSSGFLAAITDVSNGWYRISLTGLTTAENWYHELALTSGNIVIQDAQMEQGLVATDVITTTTSSVTVGITDDLPRVDYSGGGCPSLLLEPSRTNVFTQSEYFADWNISGAIATNTTISPEGVQNASTFTTSSAGEDLRDNTNVTGTYAFSVFVKLIDVGGVRLRIDAATDANAYFDLSDGSVYNSDGIIEADAINYGNNWWRVYMVANVTNTQKLQVFTTDGTTSYENGSVYLYGAMLEAGSYSTSYIPSYGTSTSRSADSCSLTNASNLIGQSEGTAYIQVKDFSYNPQSVLLKLKSSSLVLLSIQTRTTNQIRFEGTGFDYFYTPTQKNLKIAVRYSSSELVIYINGIKEYEDTSITVNAADAIYLNEGGTGIEFLNETILFPTALTDTQLQELTK